MAFIYTRTLLKSRINAGIQGRIGMLIDEDDTANEAVREVLGDFELRSTRRRASLVPNLFNGIFEYSAPSDMAADKIIDIPAQAKRQDGSFFLVPSEEFDRSNQYGDGAYDGYNGYPGNQYSYSQKGMISIDEFNGGKILKINSSVDSSLLVLSELDSITSGATWAVFGDAENLATDGDDFIKGAGSVKFDISAAGGTTAGITAGDLNTFDLTSYLNGNGALFVWHKITDITDITSYTARIGTDSSNYYSKTITTQNDGTAFVNGWNLLRFDLVSLTETGTNTDTTNNYIVLFMNKDSGKVSETDYKFDYIALMRGVNHYTKYYTKFGWQSSAGAYKENSTDDLDLLVADADEFKLITKKGIALAAAEVDDERKAAIKETEYENALSKYKIRNPSEAKILTNEYYRY